MPVSAALRRTLVDRLGVGASVVCLVHCLLTPFVLAGLAAFGASGGGHADGDHGAHLGFHALVLAGALPLALASAWPGYREHRRRSVLALLGAGVALLLLSFAAHDAFASEETGEAVHTALTVLGSALLVWGHVRNYRLRARCGAHVLPHHAAHDAAHRHDAPHGASHGHGPQHSHAPGTA